MLDSIEKVHKYYSIELHHKCCFKIEKLSEDFGERFLKNRDKGFKADYFAAVADSTITECTFLDNAVHPADQTLMAFSQFISIVSEQKKQTHFYEQILNMN